MNYTILDTPILKQIVRWFSFLFLKMMGWKVEGQAPNAKKYVIIAAPHTSNWDFPITLALVSVLGIKWYWMGKDKLFKGIWGPIGRYMGGISIDRSKSNNAVAAMAKKFEESDELVIVIPAEGTRKKVEYWKSGFYYIALEANVPIALGFADYKRKVGGLGPLFYPTGNIETDLLELKKFYEGIGGKYPERVSEISFRPQKKIVNE